MVSRTGRNSIILDIMQIKREGLRDRGDKGDRSWQWMGLVGIDIRGHLGEKRRMCIERKEDTGGHGL